MNPENPQQPLPTTPEVQIQPDTTNTPPIGPVQQPVAQPATPMQPMISNNPKKSYVGLIIGLIIVGFISLLLVLAILLYVFVFSPTAQAKKASTEFMNAATTGDTQKLYETTNTTEDSEKTFLKNISESLTGNYKLIESTSENNKWYFLYEMKDAKSNYARTIVEKLDSKMVVTSIVIGDNKLALIPGGSSENEEPVSQPIAATEPVPESTPATQGVCLVNDDYRWLSYDDSIPTVNYVTPEPDGFITMYEANIFFEADSAKESSDWEYEYWSEFGTKNINKDWKYVLKGSIWQASGSTFTDPASIKLANDRAQQVKSQLVSRGVPESKIEIATPTEHAEEYQPGFSAEIFRRTALFVDNGCVTYPETVTSRTYN